jgi:hypothetical protein
MHMRMMMLLCGWAALLAGCATAQKHTVKVDSTPPDALVTVCSAPRPDGSQIKKIAGATPIVKELQFGKDAQLWLEIEKRGYSTAKVPVRPDTGDLNVMLTRLTDTDGAPATTYAFPEIKRIMIADPDFKLIQRGFSSEAVSDELSKEARQALIQGIQRFFDARCETAVLPPALDSRPVRTVWRDVRTRMEFINPVRLKYQARPVLLETAGGRSAALELGRQFHADVLLFIAGKENVETKGMLAGKFGMTVIGTANSYAAGYSRAMANGDSYFAYNVITPHFAEGAALNAVMIHCGTGEIVWANNGVWRPIAFDTPAAVDQVVSDLLYGLK